MSADRTKPKTPLKTPPQTPPAEAETDAATFTDSERAELHATVHRLRDKTPRATASERAGFMLLASDAHCSSLGKGTKGHGVARDSVAFARTIDATLTAHGGRVAEYNQARFAFLLDCIAILLRELDTQDAARNRTATARAAADVAEVDALSARAKLLRKLSAFAGQRADERKALADKKGTTESRASIATSLTGLIDLAREWLAPKNTQEGAANASIASAVGLTESIVKSAEKARDALVKKGVDASLGGALPRTDAPTVNLAEGRVLVEMEAAMIAFENGHDDDDRIPKLVPGAATRRALGKKAPTSTDNAQDDATKTPNATHNADATPTDAAPSTPKVASAKPKRSKKRSRR